MVPERKNVAHSLLTDDGQRGELLKTDDKLMSLLREELNWVVEWFRSGKFWPHSLLTDDGQRGVAEWFRSGKCGPTHY